MTSIILRNLYIDHNDPCEAKWRLEVVQLALVKHRRSWSENKENMENMQLVVEFRGLSKRIEMERTFLENKHLSNLIDFDNQNIFM